MGHRENKQAKTQFINWLSTTALKYGLVVTFSQSASAFDIMVSGRKDSIANHHPFTVGLTIQADADATPEQLERWYKVAPPRVAEKSIQNWRYLEEQGIWPPTRDSLSFLMELEGLEPADVADLVGVDVKSVIGWLSNPSAKSARTMPNAHWELILLKTGRHPTKLLSHK